MSDALSDFFRHRYSVRDFLPDPVPPELLEQVIADGLSAPSWSNTRPYRLAVATGDTRRDISAELATHWAEASRLRFGSFVQKIRALVSGRALPASDFLVPLNNPADLQGRRVDLAKKLFGHIGIERGDVAGREAAIAKNFDFFGAPVVIFVFVRSRMGVYSPLDAGFFSQNLLLSAAHRGLGACAQGFLAVWSRPVKKRFAIPRGYKLLYGISLGYPAPTHINTFRAPVTAPGDILLATTP
jgi:nitroreductase